MATKKRVIRGQSTNKPISQGSAKSSSTGGAKEKATTGPASSAKPTPRRLKGFKAGKDL